ncbi:MAG: hypothetical protein LBR73_07630 [Oscillospiraceae bacterium]|nr:hypothetical protein [Oscillospiraceae bacterium]
MKYKTNTPARLACILLVFALFTTGLTSGTFAKYYAVATGTATARVAKFSVQVWKGTKSGDSGTTTTDTDWDEIAVLGSEPTVTVSLWDTMTEAKDQVLANPRAERYTSTGDIYPANGSDKIIAPGTGGKFRIVARNMSEVAVKIDVSVGGDDYKNEGNIPIEWSVGGAAFSSIQPTTAQTASGIYTPNNADGVNATTVLKPSGATEAVFEWRWKYDNVTVSTATDGGTTPIYSSGDDRDRDIGDTTLGIGSGGTTATLSVPLTITAIQID